jgi:chitosanase
MPRQEISTEIKRQLDAIVSAAQALEATVQDMAQSAAAPAPAQAHLPRAMDAAAAAATTLDLSEGQRRICERVINVFETGTLEGKYGAISIFHDGPGRIRQVTYGRSQTTEYGNLRELVQMYADANGTFSARLRPFIDRIGRTALVDDDTFKDLLRRAGNEDPVMRTTQDLFFERRYFQPALSWARENGFTRALSMLVIYDSFIHSGSIRSDLRNRFPERPPARGGDEKTWISQYVAARHAWLPHHSNPEVRPSNYRTRDLGREVAAGNWDLAIQPIMANGVPVRDTPPEADAVMRMAAFDGGPAFGAGAAPYPGGDEWCEHEPPAQTLAAASFGAAAPFDAVAVAAATPAELADRILNHPNIKLATSHVSGVNDSATARQNIIDTAAGQPARRSSYGNAPGGTVRLDADMLRGLLALADTYSFHVSELCGASHSTGSRHYRGVTADFNFINGQHISASHPDQAAFRSRCQALGATQVLGPGNTGHSTHIHAAWPT